VLYRGLRRLDAAHGAASWPEALAWLAEAGAGAPIAEIQFWGHGKWGCALIDGAPLDGAALAAAHPLAELLRAIRARFVPQGGLWWFRTCETFGAAAGQDFARAWAEFFGVRVAGHTFIIGYYQSGLHALRPGERPAWSPEEGLARGTAEQPEQAHWSAASAPHTITCWQGRVPDGW
jgi:hypothetical protein